jgi:Co/Zn/Cd efflux system component
VSHHAHAHAHGLLDPSIRRSREGLRAVAVALAVLAAAAVAQAIIFVATGSVALLADLIHNFGDALTAVPVGAAFLLGSERAERYAGVAVVAAIFVSACVAGYESILRLLSPRAPEHLGALAAAGAIGFFGNWVAARVREGAGHRLGSPALIADGAHARADAYVSLGVVGERRGGRPWAGAGRSADWPRDHRRDPPYHVAVLARDSAWSPPLSRPPGPAWRSKRSPVSPVLRCFWS